MQIRCLGPLRAVDDGQERPLGGPKQRLVLAHLLIRSNQVVPADRLITEVWDGAPPSAARSSLQSYVSHLRKALGANRLQSSGQGYALRVEFDDVDRMRFERLVADARRLRATDPAAAAAALRDALDLWDGPAFADLSDAPSLQPEITRLEELRIGALEDRVDADLDAGRARELVGELEALTAEHPLRERLWSQLMVALYRSGRQGDALAAFDRARALLADELGVDPSAELRALHERVLRQDPGLQSATPTLKGYRLLERIGEGAFGVVWRARQSGVDRDVVIKAARPALANDPAFVRHFAVHAQRVARIEHPHVVPLYDFWREPDGAYLVLRYLRGGTLGDLVGGDDPPDSATAVRIADQVTQALAAAHQLNVVHGDIRPANVLLDEEANAYLADFAIDGTADQASVAVDDLPYVPPERVDGAALGPQADVFSLGILLDALLSDLDGDVAEVVSRAMSRDPDQRQRDATELLSELRAAVGSTPTATPRRDPTAARTATALAPRNPYKGLRAFVESDAGDFFGRDAVVARLLSRLRDGGRAARFLAVVGPSGSGKSSVVRAGLVPALRAGVIDGSDAWFIVQLVPGDRPFDELATALQRVAVDPPDDLADRLAEGGGFSAATQLLPDDGELLIVIDQFEELFTLASDTEARQRFIGALVDAVTAPDSRIRVVVTLRADFYDRPLEHHGLGALMQARTETLLPLGPAELEHAIAGPAEQVGVAVERPLVAQMVADVADQPGGLPLLQFALTELFDASRDGALAADDYRGIGGVTGALTRRAETIYQGLPAAAREAARQLFLQLVTPGEGVEDTRRRVGVADVTGAAPDEMAGVLDAFGAARLLSFDRDPETRAPTVEVAHEALLREWQRLRGWIDAARDDLRVHRRLRAAAADWAAADHDPSFLAAGARLDQYAAWRHDSGLAATDTEQAYLDASIDARDRASAEEAARRERELALERRSVRRLRTLVTVLGIAALIAGGLTVFATGQARRAADEALRAERGERVATARELAAASLAVMDEDAELGVLLALEAVERTRVADGSVLPEAEEALHRAVTSSRIALRVPGLGGSVDWHPDGTMFVTEGPEESGLVDLRDAETGESVRTYTGHNADINDVAFSADGSLLATTGDDGLLRVWDPESGDMQAELAGSGPVYSPSFSPDGSRVAGSWVNEGMVRVTDLAGAERPVEIRAQTTQLGDGTSFSPDGDQLAIADTTGVVVVDPVTGERLQQFQPGTADVVAVDWSPDGRWIASADAGPTVRVTDAHADERHVPLSGHTGEVLSFDWSPDGDRLATGSRDGTARVWGISDGDAVELVSVSSPEAFIGGVAFSPDGERLLTGDVLLAAAKIWDVGITGGAEWMNLPTSTDVPTTAVFTPDGDDLVLTGDGAHAVVWDLAAGTPRRTLGTGQGDARRIKVSPDGELIATIAFVEPPRVRVWDRRSGTEAFVVAEPGFYPDSAAWSPDAELLAVTWFNGRGGPSMVTVVDRTGTRVAELVEDDNFVPLDVVFSPDGDDLITVRDAIDRPDPTIDGVRVWDWARGEVRADIRVYAQEVAVDPTGTRIATSDAAGASIWAVGSGQRLATLTGHLGDVDDVAFSPDGDTVATAGTDGTVRLWATESGTEQLVLDGHDGPVTSVAFDSDGNRLVSTGAGVARVWALDIDDLIAIAQDKLTRHLTKAECREYLHVDVCPSPR